MIITVDNFSYVSFEDGFTYNVIVKYNTDTKRFTNEYSSIGTNKMPYALFLTVEQRGYNEDQFLFSQCSGFNNINFTASLSFPYAIAIIDINSTICGFTQLPTPPPSGPPSGTCNLTLTAISQSQSAFNVNDGTVKATISQTVAGYVQVTIYKSATIIPIKSFVLGPALTEYTFNGLEPGSYRLTAIDINTLCTATPFDITVAAFAFNEHYYFEFCEERFAQRTVRISIKTKGYAGAPILIENASANVLNIAYKNSNQDKFEPIFGSNADISIVTKTEFQYSDLYLNEEKKHLCEIIIGGTLFWSGYLTADRVAESFKEPPYLIRLSALDGIKLLSDIDFDLSSGYLTPLEIIKYAVDKTQLSLPFKTMIDIVDFVNQSGNGIISGFNIEIYGLSIIVSSGTYKSNGTSLSAPADSFVISSLPSTQAVKYYYLYVGAGGFLSLSDIVLNGNVLVATFTQNEFGITVQKTPYYIDDTLMNHKLNVYRFIKNNGDFENCLNVLRFVCKQFTAKIKQDNGHWVIEDDGAKARGNLTEFVYDKNLKLISSGTANIFQDLSCSTNSNVLDGGVNTLIVGNKKSIVKWKLGYPAPIFGNSGFEFWVNNAGKLVPISWQYSTPLDWFERGSKYERIYDPTNGNLTTQEDGTYYFKMLGTFFNNIRIPKNYTLKLLSSTNIIVFSQEVIQLSFQAIVNNNNTTGLPIFLSIYLNLGNYRFVNFHDGAIVEPLWVLNPREIDYFSIFINNDDKKPAFGDATNVSIETLPTPSQGLFNIKISEPVLGTDFTVLYQNDRLSPRFVRVSLGLDNFQVKKTSPVTNARVLEETLITVQNVAKFSHVPEDFEVYFGDVESNLRTDGIRTLNNTPTTLWKRIGVDEADPINNIIAKELLSQYQRNTLIFEGDIIAENLSVRNIFNLPSYELYKFATLDFNYNVIKCAANVTLAEIYAKDSPNSGAIGGGSGGASGQVPDGNLVIGWNGLKILSDNNNNIFKVTT